MSEQSKKVALPDPWRITQGSDRNVARLGRRQIKIKALKQEHLENVWPTYDDYMEKFFKHVPKNVSEHPKLDTIEVFEFVTSEVDKHKAAAAKLNPAASELETMYGWVTFALKQLQEKYGNLYNVANHHTVSVPTLCVAEIFEIGSSVWFLNEAFEWVPFCKNIRIESEYSQVPFFRNFYPFCDCRVWVHERVADRRKWAWYEGWQLVTPRKDWSGCFRFDEKCNLVKGSIPSIPDYCLSNNNPLCLDRLRCKFLNLEGSKVMSAKESMLQFCSFENCRFQGIDFTNSLVRFCNFRNVWWKYSTLTGARFRDNLFEGSLRLKDIRTFDKIPEILPRPDDGYIAVKDGLWQRYLLALYRRATDLDRHEDELTILRKCLDRLFSQTITDESFSESVSTWLMLAELLETASNLSSAKAHNILLQMFDVKSRGYAEVLKVVNSADLKGGPPEDFKTMIHYFGQRLREPYFRIMTDLRMEISYIARIKKARRQMLTQTIAIIVTSTLSLSSLLWLYLDKHDYF